MYFEIDSGATDDAANTFDTSYDLFNPDWIGNPGITEAKEQVAYLEMGGVAYYGISSGSGTYSALLAGGPGTVPAYRGTNQKLSGLALTTQGQLNTLVGNIWENMNADYPDVDFDLAGNFRNIDIAPQEIVKVTLNVDDTYRGISWAQKEFTPRSMSWSYNSEQNLLLPSMSLKEITAGDDGQTIAIPVAPPEDSGYDQPPIQLPPPMPAFPIPPLDWSVNVGYVIVPALGGYDGTNITNWLDATIEGSNIAGVNIEVDGANAGGVWGVPLGVSTVTAIPIIANNGAGQTIDTYFSMQSFRDGAGSPDFDSASGDHIFGAGDLEWLSGHSLSFGVAAGDVLVFLSYSNEGNDELAVWGWLLTLT